MIDNIVSVAGIVLMVEIFIPLKKSEVLSRNIWNFLTTILSSLLTRDKYLKSIKLLFYIHHAWPQLSNF